MKSIVVITPFDGAKFMARYGLAFGSFSMNGDVLTYPDSVRDDPPILEAHDPPPPPEPTVKDLLKRIEALEAK